MSPVYETTLPGETVVKNSAPLSLVRITAPADPDVAARKSEAVSALSFGFIVLLL